MSKVIVGMSGGVDSAVTAYLLQLAGYDVIGVTIRTWMSSDGKESRCCEIDDARIVSSKLGIPYYVSNCISDFREHITKPFIADYLNGITPNPCVFCNKFIKWDKMLKSADVMNAEYIATGHYASIVKKDNGRFTVQKASYIAKDQTYMLYRLTQDQLSRTIMPLGKLNKEEVREIARKAGLSVAEKADSQEICFVTDGNYVNYIEDNTETDIPGEGLFLDEDGNVLGKHKGIINYTVGQRKGLGLALGYPAYVKQIDAKNNTVIIGDEKSLYSSEIICKDLNFMSIPDMKSGEKIKCNVKVRYHHTGQSAEVLMLDSHKVKVIFNEPVRAACPGQSAVFYDEENCVIGGGIIEDVCYLTNSSEY